MEFELLCIPKSQEWKAWPQRVYTLTVFHSCHRPRFPVGHVLIERSCVTKHCKKREGCNKEKKDETHHTNNNNTRSRFKPQTTRKSNTCETCDPTNLELSYIHSSTNTTTEGCCGHRGREEERVHLLRSIVVTAPVFHLDKSALKLPNVLAN